MRLNLLPGMLLLAGVALAAMPCPQTLEFRAGDQCLASTKQVFCAPRQAGGTCGSKKSVCDGVTKPFSLINCQNDVKKVNGQDNQANMCDGMIECKQEFNNGGSNDCTKDDQNG